jgi:hypothetical protein
MQRAEPQRAFALDPVEERRTRQRQDQRHQQRADADRTVMAAPAKSAPSTPMTLPAANTSSARSARVS